jgi:hypothetical protein
MKNPKVQFSLDDNGSIFCYSTSENLPADGIYATESGCCYDMAVLKHLLVKGEPIDEAVIGRVPATGKCHWVFEGDVQNEVSARKAADAAGSLQGEGGGASEVAQLRKQVEQLEQGVGKAAKMSEDMREGHKIQLKLRDDRIAQLKKENDELSARLLNEQRQVDEAGDARDQADTATLKPLPEHGFKADAAQDATPKKEATAKTS